MRVFPYPPKTVKAVKNEILEALWKINDFLNDYIRMKSYFTYQISKNKTETLLAGVLENGHFVLLEGV